MRPVIHIVAYKINLFNHKDMWPIGDYSHTHFFPSKLHIVDAVFSGNNLIAFFHKM